MARPSDPPSAAVSAFQNIQQAARWSGRSDETLYRWIAAGKLKAFKVGRSTVVKTDDLLALLTATPVRLVRKARAA
nr:helix-turn-helix domain-containing protein [Neoroseomonas oryzicola]